MSEWTDDMAFDTIPEKGAVVEVVLAATPDEVLTGTVLRRRKMWVEIKDYFDSGRSLTADENMILKWRLVKAA